MPGAVAEYDLHVNHLLHLAALSEGHPSRTWILAVACASAAASTVLSGNEVLDALVAGLALLGVILPGALKAVKMDETINAYIQAAADFKVVEGALRRAADVWSHKPYEQFEQEARCALAALDKARENSLTPPEWCFRVAQKKVKSGDYDPDPADPPI